MVASSANEPSRLGKYILQYRAPIGLTLIAITAFMALWAARVQIGTKFENFFPANHPDTPSIAGFSTGTAAPKLCC
jgi:predicted RND superfamily exporter protein